MRTTGMLLVLVGLVTIGVSQSNDNRPRRPTLTNEDLLKERIPIAAGPAINSGDDPLDVVERARVALARDTSHRCRQEVSNNSGPGSFTVLIIEVAGPDRFHMVVEERRSQPSRKELIIVGDDSYLMTGSGPWIKTKVDARLYHRSTNVQMPERSLLDSQYKGWDLKLVGREVLDGAPVFQYQFTFKQSGFFRTITTWVGINDNLPRGIEIFTEDRSLGSVPVVTRDTTSCTYGTSFRIEPPF